MSDVRLQIATLQARREVREDRRDGAHHLDDDLRLHATEVRVREHHGLREAAEDDVAQLDAAVGDDVAEREVVLAEEFREVVEEDEKDEKDDGDKEAVEEDVYQIAKTWSMLSRVGPDGERIKPKDSFEAATAALRWKKLRAKEGAHEARQQLLLEDRAQGSKRRREDDEDDEYSLHD